MTKNYTQFILMVGAHLMNKSCANYMVDDMQTYLDYIHEHYSEVGGKWQDKTPKQVASELLDIQYQATIARLGSVTQHKVLRVG